MEGFLRAWLERETDLPTLPTPPTSLSGNAEGRETAHLFKSLPTVLPYLHILSSNLRVFSGEKYLHPRAGQRYHVLYFGAPLHTNMRCSFVCSPGPDTKTVQCLLLPGQSPNPILGREPVYLNPRPEAGELTACRGTVAGTTVHSVHGVAVSHVWYISLLLPLGDSLGQIHNVLGSLRHVLDLSRYLPRACTKGKRRHLQHGLQKKQGSASWWLSKKPSPPLQLWRGCGP